MKFFLILSVLLVPLLHSRRLEAQQKEIFLKQLEFKLDHVSSNQDENEYFETLKLNKGTSYTFKIINHQDNYAGRAVLELLDADKTVMTNMLNGKYFETLNFVCNKTGFYDILIHYADKKPGYSVVDIMMKQ